MRSFPTSLPRRRNLFALEQHSSVQVCPVFGSSNAIGCVSPSAATLLGTLLLLFTYAPQSSFLVRNWRPNYWERRQRETLSPVNHNRECGPPVLGLEGQSNGHACSPIMIRNPFSRPCCGECICGAMEDPNAVKAHNCGHVPHLLGFGS